jgi:general secretion pathway protein B
MSSILKALKKLEEEKSRLEEPKEINVSREILRQPTEQKKLLKWLWLLGSSAALVILMLTVALLRKPAPSATVPVRQPPPAALPAAPLARQENLPLAPQLSGRGKSPLPTAPIEAAEPTRKVIRQLPEQAEVRSVRQEMRDLLGGTEPASDQRVTAPATNAAPDLAMGSYGTALTLSGIAWNKDSADRLAIINGQPSAIGTTIGGVIVEEILLDRVKLSRNGRSFELLIGKSTTTE